MNNFQIYVPEFVPNKQQRRGVDNLHIALYAAPNTRTKLIVFNELNRVLNEIEKESKQRDTYNNMVTLALGEWLF
jgi:hypothetical protein